MSTEAPPRVNHVAESDRAQISRVPYLPGLDGMRALAVVAVMVYHANNAWLPGGFLGVEMFFVISGYLITLLLIGEHERNYRISLGHFWLRRARRLLPALFMMMLLVTIWTAIFERDALGQLRGDVLAGSFYVSNWYQIWVGQGYTASGDFAPLRHLWSLAVEEQFYLWWPIVMILLARAFRYPTGGRRQPMAAPRRARHHGRDRTGLLPRRDRHGRHHTARVLVDRRPLDRQARHALPEHGHPGRWTAPRFGVRLGLAAVRRDARAAANQGSDLRRRRGPVVGGAGVDGRDDPSRHGRRRLGVAVPRRAVPRRSGDARADRRRHARRHVLAVGSSASGHSCGSGSARTVSTSTTGRSS